MFKKVVLSGLLSVAMVFSVSVTAGAEGNNDIKLCKQACWIMKNYEKQNMNEIEKVEEKKNSAIKRKYELEKEYFDELIKLSGKPNFDKNKENVDFRHKLSVSVAGEDNKINLYNAVVKLIENATRNSWENFHEICPATFCEGSKYGKENSSSATQNNSSAKDSNNITRTYLNKAFFGCSILSAVALLVKLFKTPIILAMDTLLDLE